MSSQDLGQPLLGHEPITSSTTEPSFVVISNKPSTSTIDQLLFEFTLQVDNVQVQVDKLQQYTSNLPATGCGTGTNPSDVEMQDGLLDKDDLKERRRKVHKELKKATAKTQLLYDTFKNDEFSTSNIIKASTPALSDNSKDCDESSSSSLTNVETRNSQKREQTLASQKLFLSSSNRQARATHNRQRREFQKDIMRLEKITKLAREFEREAVMRISGGSRMSGSSDCSLDDSVMSSASMSSASEMQGDRPSGTNHRVEADNTTDHNTNKRVTSATQQEEVTPPTPKPNAGTGSFQQQSRIIYADSEFTQVLVNERNREITQIHSSMVQVNEIYKDLGNLVDDQQLEIDDIEQNIENAATAAKEAASQLEGATVYQKKSGKAGRWILTLLLVAVVVVLGIFLGPSIYRSFNS